MAKIKLNVENARVKGVGKVSKTVQLLLLLAGVVTVIIGFNLWSTYELKQQVEIVKLSSSVPQDGRVIQENLVKATMSKAEYENQGIYIMADGTKKRSIVLWEDRERIQNAFASYYIRQNTPLYWDSLTKETPKKYSYLYKMDGELLKINLDAEEFGQMLVPGDKINVRATYTENEYVLPTEKDFMLQQQMGIQTQTTKTKNIMLFNNVVVLDILNSDGESIFDIYYRLLALPKSEQRAMVASKEFAQMVVPSHILLNVTPEEADRYMSITNSGPKYLMTLLPRASGNLITEALNELQIGFARD